MYHRKHGSSHTETFRWSLILEVDNSVLQKSNKSRNIDAQGLDRFLVNDGVYCCKHGTRRS